MLFSLQEKTDHQRFCSLHEREIQDLKRSFSPEQLQQKLIYQLCSSESFFLETYPDPAQRKKMLDETEWLEEEKPLVADEVSRVLFDRIKNNGMEP